MSDKLNITTSNGAKVSNDQESLRIGQRGPVLLQDFHLIDKLAHFDRERIPERVVHAKGSGAYGVFKCTHDVSKYTIASIFQKGEETPTIARFSTVGGEKGSADSERDPRGFAIKFYSKEGNYDLVGNNTPIFFIRDGIKFPDFIHTQKRNPQTNLKDANMVWDFWSQTPESLHQVTYLFGDRGIPYGYRHMNGYGSHTFQWVNKDKEVFFIKYHFKTNQGIKNCTVQQADELKSSNPDYAQQDLFENIEKKNYPSWTLYVQIMTYEQGLNYKYDIFDITKIWSHKDCPLIEVGQLTLNRNPLNYFAEVEQVAFSPSHMIPGIEPSPDYLLQARLFSYPDTHRHRLGTNYQQIPVNFPYRAKINNTQRDGPMNFDNQGNNPIYYPNTINKYEFKDYESKISYNGEAFRHPRTIIDNDFKQVGELYWNVFSEEERERTTDNIVAGLKQANKEIQIKTINLFAKCHQHYGESIAKKLGLNYKKSLI